MSVRIQTCYTIRCDGMKADGKPCEATVDHDYVPHYPDAEYAREEACDEYGWYSDGTTDLCGICKFEPHEFVAEDRGKYPVDCARCGLERDEHEDVPVGSAR